MAKKALYSGPVVTTYEDQTKHWVAGRSYHVKRAGCSLTECCPDFSCCNPDLLQPLAVRKAYAAGDSKLRNKLCMEFLGALLAARAPKTRVHITGGDPPEEN